MKSWICILLVLVMVALSSCSYEDRASADNGVTTAALPSSNVSIQYLGENSEKNRISVEIPVFSGNEYQPLNDCVSNMLISEIRELCDNDCNLTVFSEDCMEEGSTYTDYYIDIDACVVWQSDDVVSILFEGFFDKKSTAHPTNLLFSISMDVKTQTRLDFGSLYVLDDELYQTFAQIAEADILRECDETWLKGWSGFSEELCSQERFLNGMRSGKEFHWYYTENGVCISYPVPYSMGDHKEVLIPFEKLQKAKE